MIKEEDISQSLNFQLAKMETEVESFSQQKLQLGFQKSMSSANKENNNVYLSQRMAQMIQNLQEDLIQNEEYKKRKLLGFMMDKIKLKSLKKSKLIKNLTRKWTNLLLKILKQNIQEFSIIDPEKIKGLIQVFKIPIPKLQELSKALVQNQWFVTFILQTQIKDHLLLEKIYNDTNLNSMVKISMIMSYPILVKGFKNPSSFLWWNQRKSETLVNYSIIIDKYDFNEILKLVREEYQRIKDKFEKNKCSTQNNITYHWLCRFKHILNQPKLKNKYQDFDSYKQCIKKTKKCSISAIKELLEVQWFNSYLREEKINNLMLVKDILNDPNIHILNKKNLLQTYPIVTECLYNPGSLFSWSRKLTNE